MGSGAVASRHERKQAKAAARRVTGPAVVLLSSRIGVLVSMRMTAFVG